MIGTIHFTKPVSLIAQLDDGGTWHCRFVALEKHLNAHYAPDQHGPAPLPFGVCALYAAAAALGGEATLARPVPKLPKNAVA